MPVSQPPGPGQFSRFGSPACAGFGSPRRDGLAIILISLAVESKAAIASLGGFFWQLLGYWFWGSFRLIVGTFSTKLTRSVLVSDSDQK